MLFLSPTKELSTKTAANELMGRVRSRIINEDTVGKGNVTSELAKHFKKPSEFAESLVFATHAALPYLRFIANQRHWHVIIDEELQVIQYVCHRLPKMHGLITDDTRLESHNSIYSRIVPCNMSALEEKAKNKDDDEVYKVVAGTIGRLLNPHWLNYVNTEQYERLRRGESQTLAIHSILSPSIVEGFASVLMTAANFEDTALYQLWSEWNGAEDTPLASQPRFIGDNAFLNSLRFQSHQNGQLLTIHYGMNATNSKKRLKDGADANDNRTNRDRLIDSAKQLFGDEAVRASQQVL